MDRRRGGGIEGKGWKTKIEFQSPSPNPIWEICAAVTVPGGGAGWSRYGRQGRMYLS